MNKISHKFIILFFLIVLFLPAVLPLFQKGFFTTDDGEWMIIRFSAFHQTLRDGELPVRSLGRLNQEYGYPVATFLYPGFMYLAEPFHLIGFGFVDSIKIILGLSLLLSGVFFYFWLRSFFDKIPSFVGALFYVYAPYHLYDLYKRGSVGELLALAVLPFILWQIERKSIFWSSLGIALLIISHNTLALLFLLLLFVYVCFQIFQSKNKKSLIIKSLIIYLLGFGMSAFFWLPVVFELQYTVFSKTTVSDWREYFAPVNLIGYSSFVVVVLSFLVITFKKIDKKKHGLALAFLGVCIVTIFLAMPASSFFWNFLPVSFVQFPFRLLSVTIISVAFLAAYCITTLQGKRKYVLSVILVIILFTGALPFFKTGERFDKGEGYYATNMATTTVLGEYMPVWVKEIPLQKAETKAEIVKGKGSIENIVYNNRVISFTVNNEKLSIIRIHTIYWPGWEVKIDGRAANISYNNPRGLMEVRIPEGKHTIVFTFTETPLRILSDVLSIASFIILIVLTVLRKKNNKKL